MPPPPCGVLSPAGGDRGLPPPDGRKPAGAPSAEVCPVCSGGGCRVSAPAVQYTLIEELGRDGNTHSLAGTARGAHPLNSLTRMLQGDTWPQRLSPSREPAERCVPVVCRNEASVTSHGGLEQADPGIEREGERRELTAGPPALAPRYAGALCQRISVTVICGTNTKPPHDGTGRARGAATTAGQPSRDTVTAERRTGRAPQSCHHQAKCVGTWNPGSKWNEPKSVKAMGKGEKVGLPAGTLVHAQEHPRTLGQTARV